MGNSWFDNTKNNSIILYIYLSIHDSCHSIRAIQLMRKSDGQDYWVCPFVDMESTTLSSHSNLFNQNQKMVNLHTNDKYTDKTFRPGEKKRIWLHSVTLQTTGSTPIFYTLKYERAWSHTQYIVTRAHTHTHTHTHTNTVHGHTIHTNSE
jgi:hypothetical protein